jgi:hypothetical protein
LRRDSVEILLNSLLIELFSVHPEIRSSFKPLGADDYLSQ